MKKRKCECSMAISILGDGCSICNPQFYIEHMSDYIKDLEKEIEDLESRTCSSCRWFRKGADLGDLNKCMQFYFEPNHDFSCNVWKDKNED